MAFQVLNQPQQQQQAQDWAAVAFINLNLPREDGNLGKIGAIPLRLKDEEAVALAKWIEVDPDNRLAQLKEALVLTYNSANKPKSRLAILG